MYRWIISTTLVCAALVWIAPQASAASPSVLISEVQTGDARSASNEIVEIYNVATEPIDITGWCLYYMNASLTHVAKAACFVPDDATNRLFLLARSYASAMSTHFVQDYPESSADIYFSATLSQSAGHIKLVDASGNEVDRVGWGTSAIGPETMPAEAASDDFMLARNVLNDIVIDTDDNSTDFLVLPVDGIFRHGQVEVVVVVDKCRNIDDIQLELPDSFMVNESGDCYPLAFDACLNIEGEQATIPDDFYVIPDSFCAHDLLSLTLTELHPNPTGGDAGHEFIEIYNPNEIAIDLSDYLILVGLDGQYSVGFQAGDMIEPLSYRVIYNDNVSFTLVNTSSSVKVTSYEGMVIDESQLYTDPKENESWALIEGVWQMTNRPTPGATNLLSLQVLKNTVEAQAVSRPCAANQYRSPETNRCRQIATAVSSLAACGPGEQRNPATNRCRKIAESQTVLTPCKEGQERNPETNRCRNVVAENIPEAKYGVMGAQTTEPNNMLLWAIVGVTLVGSGYAIWEWRREITKLWTRIAGFVRIKK